MLTIDEVAADSVARPALPYRSEAWLVPPSKYEKVAGLHQYYRDCLSRDYEFPGIGKFPPDLLRWAVANTDSVRLAEMLARVQDTGLGANHELALRLMLFTIQQANLALDRNNDAPNFMVPAGVAESVRQGLERVVALHPQSSYVVMAAQLLYRIKAIDDFIAVLQKFPKVLASSPTLQGILGFIETISGNYAEGLRHLEPLKGHAKWRDGPVLAL